MATEFKVGDRVTFIDPDHHFIVVSVGKSLMKAQSCKYPNRPPDLMATWISAKRVTYTPPPGPNGERFVGISDNWIRFSSPWADRDAASTSSVAGRTSLLAKERGNEDWLRDILQHHRDGYLVTPEADDVLPMVSDEHDISFDWYGSIPRLAEHDPEVETSGEHDVEPFKNYVEPMTAEEAERRMREALDKTRWKPPIMFGGKPSSARWPKISQPWPTPKPRLLREVDHLYRKLDKQAKDHATGQRLIAVENRVAEIESARRDPMPLIGCALVIATLTIAMVLFLSGIGAL